MSASWRTARSYMLKRSSEAGNGKAYFPALIRLLDAQGKG
mgnify:CR=1 FL=1